MGPEPLRYTTAPAWRTAQRTIRITYSIHRRSGGQLTPHFLRGLLMETSRRLWVLALVLGIGGCAGDESGSPAAGTAGAGGPTTPAVKKFYPSGGQAAAGPATAPGTGTNAVPAPS